MTTAFCNGCFDLLAPHHVEFLRRSAEFGDTLIVGVNSDASVRRLKGEGRPIYTEAERVAMLLAVRWVDLVIVFDSEQDLADILARIKPDVLVKGEEYRGKPVTGAEHAERVEYLDGSFVGGITQTILPKLRALCSASSATT